MTKAQHVRGQDKVVGGEAVSGLDGWLERVACRRAAESVLRELLLGSGFREVTLPIVERVRVGEGREARRREAPAKGYRFLDAEGGVWGLRSDVTPGLARLVWEGDPAGQRPRRLFYFAEVYRRTREKAAPAAFLQVGVEVIGAEEIREDAALMALAEAMLRSLGVPDCRITVGHTGLLREMLGRIGLSGDRLEEVLGLLQSRDYVAVQELVGSGLPSVEAQQVLELLTGRGGGLWSDGEPGKGGGPRRDGERGRDELLDSRLPARPAGVADCWRELLTSLKGGPSRACLVVDPGLVRDREYYTGTVFEVSIPGASQPVGGGGRYDGTLCPEPAVGFALDLEAVLTAIPRGTATAGVRVQLSPATLGGRLQVATIH